jgi:hypothetical protein
LAERRKSLRRSLHLPVNVRGHARGGQWEETTATTDVSHGGVALRLSRPLAVGQVVHLSLPLPEIFRRYEVTSPSYRVWALVRYAGAQGPPYRVGLMFLGRNPPRGHEHNPEGLFFLPTDPQPAWAVQRAYTRHELMLTVRLRRLDASRAGPLDELTVTEDLSQGGARVRTTLPLAKGERVQLAETDGPFEVAAVVQNVATGADRICRVHLQFLHGDEAARAAGDLLRRQGITLA